MVSGIGCQGVILGATSTVWNAGTYKIHLAQGLMPIGPNMQIADFTECDFTGYAAGGIHTDASGIGTDPTDGRPYFMAVVHTTGIPIQFAVGTPVVVTNTVTGFWIDDGVSVILAEQFDTPVNMDTAFQLITLLPLVKSSGLDGPDAYEV